ncbi:MAG: hypothetical protein ACHQCE_22575, partial [Streptosporangiales bacterium]
MVKHQVAGALIGGVLSLALACSGCDPTSGGDPASGVPGTPAAAGTARPAATQAPSTQASKPLSCAARVFSRMTVAQRAGQLFMVGIADAPGSEVARA